MRPTALFLTALVLGGLMSYWLATGREPATSSRVVSPSGVEVADQPAEVRAKRAAAREQLSRDEIQRVLHTALPARFPQQTLGESDYETLTNAVLHIRAAQRALRTADTDRARIYLERRYRSRLQEALTDFQRITGMATSELGGLLGTEIDAEVASEPRPETADVSAALEPAPTREVEFLWPLAVTMLLILLWLLRRTVVSSRSPGAVSQPPRGVPILPNQEPGVPADEVPCTTTVENVPTIARLDGEAITLKDVAENFVVPDNLSAGRLWVLIERATEELVDKKLLEREAKRRSLSVDSLLRTVEAGARPASDEDIEAYFADHPAAMSEPTSRERVAHCISLKRRIERRVEFRFALRQRARFEFFLAPRSE